MVCLVNVDVVGGLGLGFCQTNLSVFPQRPFFIDHEMKTFQSLNSSR